MRLFFLFAIFLFSCGDVKEHTSQEPASAVVSNDAGGFDSLNRFLGKVRAEAKTSFVASEPDSFRSLKALRKWLESDKHMHEYTDAKLQDAPRTEEENANVTVTDLYIFGVKREDDNDFHLILASYPKLSEDQVFFSAEISGLPDPSSPYYQQLFAVREKFKTYFGDATEKETVFVASKKKPPIHLVSITGSLFFDNHHYSGHSSVKDYKSGSAWEIHPVTSITFDE